MYFGAVIALPLALGTILGVLELPTPGTCPLRAGVGAGARSLPSHDLDRLRRSPG